MAGDSKSDLPEGGPGPLPVPNPELERLYTWPPTTPVSAAVIARLRAHNPMLGLYLDTGNMNNLHFWDEIAKAEMAELAWKKKKGYLTLKDTAEIEFYRAEGLDLDALKDEASPVHPPKTTPYLGTLAQLKAEKSTYDRYAKDASSQINRAAKVAWSLNTFPNFNDLDRGTFIQVSQAGRNGFSAIKKKVRPDLVRKRSKKKKT